MPKYLNKKDKCIAHCPSCRGVLLLNVEFKNPENAVSLKIRCPHCKKDALVMIDFNSREIKIVKEGGLSEV